MVAIVLASSTDGPPAVLCESSIGEEAVRHEAETMQRGTCEARTRRTNALRTLLKVPLDFTRHVTRADSSSSVHRGNRCTCAAGAFSGRGAPARFSRGR